jgi:hypothetical protein
MTAFFMLPYSEVTFQFEAIKKLFIYQDCKWIQNTSFLDRVRLLTNICPIKKQKKMLSVGIPLLEEQLNVVSIIEQIKFLQKV